MPATTTLAGSATDDGNPNPPGALTYLWTKVSGPGDATFVDDTDPTTDVTLSEPGTYVLRLTASDGALNGSDDVTIVVTDVFVPPMPGDIDYYYGDMTAYVLWTSAHVFRTSDLQASPPVWELIDTGITGTIYSGQYIHVDEDTVGLWLMTETAIWWCADIQAVTPVWEEVLPIATVQAADAAPSSGVVEFKTMFPYWSEPGYLCVATGPDSLSESTYAHCYFWHTHDYGQNWTQIDATNLVRTVLGSTHGFYGASLYAMNISRNTGVIWCVRYTPLFSTVEVNVMISSDLGHTWTFGAAIVDFNQNTNHNSLLNPFPNDTDPSYVVSSSSIADYDCVLEVSTDGWATKSTITTPAGYNGMVGLWRVNKQTFDNNHVMGWFRHTAEAQIHLLESNDGGTTWSLLWDSNGGIGGIQNTPRGTVQTANWNMPNGWPPDVDQWVLIRAFNTGVSTADLCRLTLDNFGTLLDKSGNLFTLGGSTWPGGANDGFAVPRVGPNA